jgi:two-component system, cell cycle response regulator DivK
MKYQAQQPQNSIQGWVVLVIDDMPDNSAVAQLALEFHGAVVHTAHTGQAGLALLETIKPNVILLDIRMPQMDGWHVYEAIRKNPTHAHTPIIAVTAYAMEKDRNDALEAGFDGHIAKPFDVLTFGSQIEELATRALNKRQQANANQG